MSDYTAYMQHVSNLTATAVEQSLLEQLDFFVSRGLLFVERGEVLMTVGKDNKLSVQTTARLVLRDKEHIERIEKENAELRALLKGLAKYRPEEWA